MPEISTPDIEPRKLGRLTRLQVILAGAFSVLAGSVTTIQFCFGLAKFGGLEYAPRAALLSSVRVLGPATSVSAMLAALLIWTHRMDADAIRASLLRVAPRALLLTTVSTLATTALAASSSFFVARWVYDVPWVAIATSQTVLGFADVLTAIETLVVSAALASAFCWFALPALRQRNWSLARKLGTTWVAAILVRIVIELAYSSGQAGGNTVP